MEDNPGDAPQSRTLDTVGTTMNDLGDSMEGWSDNLRSLNDAVQGLQASMDTYGETQRRVADHLNRAADTLADGESDEAADSQSLTRTPRRTGLAADD